MLWHPRGVSSLDPETGAVYWEHEWPIGGMTVATPVSRGPYLLVTHFFRGSLMLRLDSDRPAAEELWRVARAVSTSCPARHDWPACAHHDPAHHRTTTSTGLAVMAWLRCLDARTGERVWETTELVGPERWGAAFFVQHGDRVFVTNDTGDADPGPPHTEGYDRDRPDPVARPGHPHARQRHRPVGGPWGRLVPPRLREPPPRTSCGTTR